MGITQAAKCDIVKSKPSISVLLTPSKGKLLDTLIPTLDRKDSKRSPNHFQLQVSTNSTFTNIILDENILTSSDFTFIIDLTPGEKYFWRVRAFNILDQTKGWSDTWNFKTPLDAPILDLGYSAIFVLLVLNFLQAGLCCQKWPYPSKNPCLLSGRWATQPSKHDFCVRTRFLGPLQSDDTTTSNGIVQIRDFLFITSFADAGLFVIWVLPDGGLPKRRADVGRRFLRARRRRALLQQKGSLRSGRTPTMLVATRTGLEQPEAIQSPRDHGEFQPML